MTCYTEELLDKVCDQIATDVANEDMTAIYELLHWVDATHLAGYLPEESLAELKTKWNLSKENHNA